MSNKSIVLDYWWTRGTVLACWRTRRIVRQEVQVGAVLEAEIRHIVKVVTGVIPGVLDARCKQIWGLSLEDFTRY